MLGGQSLDVIDTFLRRLGYFFVFEAKHGVRHVVRFQGTSQVLYYSLFSAHASNLLAILRQCNVMSNINVSA